MELSQLFSVNKSHEGIAEAIIDLLLFIQQPPI